MNRNVSLIYLISGLMWGRFFLPVLALFYIASQVSLSEFGIIMGVFSATILILEIPSGILADRIGKRNTLLISRFLYVVEVALLAFSNGFWPFLIAKVVSGVAVSLSSGTSQALLYDSVKRFDNENNFRKIYGTQKLISYVSMGFVFVIGAYLFTLNTKLPAYASLPLLFIGFVLTFFLKEPYPVSKNVDESSFDYLREGIKIFKRHPLLTSLVFIGLPIFIINDVSLANSSAYFALVFVPVGLIGLVNFLINGFASYLARHAEEFLSFLGKKVVYLTIGISILSCFLLGLTLPYVGIIFFFFIAGSLALYDVFLEDYSNKRILSKYRATSLSLKNMIVNLGLFFGYLLFGLISNYSINYSFYALGFVLIVFSSGVYFWKKTLFDNSEFI